MRYRGQPLVVLLVAVLPGCAEWGLVDDGTSVSWGRTNGGMILNPVELPAEGEGFYIPPVWERRGLAYGTDEMIGLIVHAGRKVAAAHPGSRIGVGDISLARGGSSQWHRSHQTGLDADILFFMKEADGDAQADPRTMKDCDADGVVHTDDGALHFDVERNWTLIKALLENPIAEIQYIFVYDPLKQKLLDHARALGEPTWLIEYASHLLHQPGDSLPHNDHFHLRIYCADGDRTMGCRDRGRMRWTKKDYKYGRDRLRWGEARAVTAVSVASPARKLLAVGGVF